MVRGLAANAHVLARFRGGTEAGLDGDELGELVSDRRSRVGRSAEKALGRSLPTQDILVVFVVTRVGARGAGEVDVTHPLRRSPAHPHADTGTLHLLQSITNGASQKALWECALRNTRWTMVNEEPGDGDDNGDHNGDHTSSDEPAGALPTLLHGLHGREHGREVAAIATALASVRRLGPRRMFAATDVSGICEAREGDRARLRSANLVTLVNIREVGGQVAIIAIVLGVREVAWLRLNTLDCV